MALPTRAGYKLATSGGTTTTTSLTLDPATPTGGGAIADGDMLIAVVSTDAGATSDNMAPSQTGWTQIRTDMTTVGTSHTRVYVRTRAAGETSYAFTWGVARHAEGTLLWLRGAQALAQWIIGAGKNRTTAPTESVTCTAPSVTTTAADTLVLSIAIERTTAAETAAQITVSNATKWTQVEQVGSCLITQTVAYKEMAATGSSGDIVTTYPNSQTSNGWAFQVAVPGTAGGGGGGTGVVIDVPAPDPTDVLAYPPQMATGSSVAGSGVLPVITVHAYAPTVQGSSAEPPAEPPPTPTEPPYVPPPPPLDAGWERIQHTLTSWTGQEFDLTDYRRGLLLMQGVRGMDDPPFLHYRDTSASVPGSYWRGMIEEARETFWPMYVYSDASSMEWLERYSDFRRALHPRHQFTWTVRTPISARSLRLRVESSGDHTYEIDPLYVGWARYGVVARADQPFWEGEEMVRVFASGGGLDFTAANGGPPFYLSAAMNAENATMSNPGDVDAHVVWRVHGPQPTGVVLGFGDAFIDVPFTLSTGETLTIDTRPSEQTAIMDDGTERTWDLGPRMDLDVGLPPGQEVPLTLDLSGSGEVEAILTPLYWRAF